MVTDKIGRKLVMTLPSCVIFLFLLSITHASLRDSHSQNSLIPQDIFYIEPPSLKTFSSARFEKHKNMTCGDLGIDQSCIIVQSDVNYMINFQYQNLECDNCSMLDVKPLKPFQAQKVLIDLASFGTEWQVLDAKNTTICKLTKNYFGEKSWYHVYVNDTGCSLVCDKKSEYAYYPLLVALAFYVLLIILWNVGTLMYRSAFFNNLFHRNSLDDLAAAFSSSSTIDEIKQKPPTQRLRSLDAVRGISIIVMIFVNYGGGKYSFFEHSHWNGLTIADLVFPWFIWMMGMSMAFSLKSQLRKVVSKKKIFLKIVKRSIILFSLGIMLNTLCLVVDLQELRISGVLQRFSISYLVVATVHLFYASADDEVQSDYPLRDITSYGGEWLIMIIFLIIHLLLSFLVHAPECPKGYFGPGGLHNQGAYSDCIGGAAGYIDRVILRPNHIYQHPSARAIYKGNVPYDPEGILGYFTSIFLVFLGLQAGKIILIYKEPISRLIRWLLWSLIIGLIAGILCCFSKNDGWIPVNKNLWSVSFILATGSLAFLLLSICFYVIDVKKWWSGAPFYQAGMNSIMLYVGHEITHNMFPWRWQIVSNHGSELFMNLWGTSLWVIIAVWMHHKNFFITI